MTERARTLALLAGADALAVVCDQFENVTLPDLVERLSLITAQAYRYAGDGFKAEGDDSAARSAFANASLSYVRAGYKKDAETMRRRATRGMPRTIRISLNGKPMDVELPDLRTRRKKR